MKVMTSTMNFNDLIGKGAFGKVYRGVYHGTSIAVKVLNEVREYIVSRSVLVLSKLNFIQGVGEKGISLPREVTTLARYAVEVNVNS